MKRMIWLLLLPLSLLGCSEPQPPVQSAAQRLEFLPAELDFGDVPVKGGRLRRVEVRNRGQGVATVRAEVEDPFEVEPETFTLAAGEAREVAVRFRPQEASAVEGEIHFRTGDGSRFPLSVKGRGVERALEIDPPTIDFGELRVGESRTERFTLRSMADGELDLLFSFRGSPVFSVDTEAFHLPGRAAVDLEVVFEPRTAGRFAGWLEISPCVDCLPVRVELTGTAIQEGLILLPVFFDFGVVPPGYSHEIEGWMKNDGNASTRVEGLKLEPPDPTVELEHDFAFPHTLEPGEELHFVLRFAPKAVGEYQGNVIVTSSAGERSVEVRARGGGPLLEAVPFLAGPLPIGYQGTGRAMILSLGEDIQGVESIELEDPSGTFRLAEPGLPPELAPGALRIPLQIRADSQGMHEAILRIHTGLRFQPVIEVPLRAHVAAPECELRFDPPGPIELGMRDGDQPLELTIRVTQEGEGECLIWEPRIVNENHAFSVVEGKVEGFRLLLPNETHEIRLHRPALTFNVRVETQTHLELSHSLLGTSVLVPISFMHVCPMPFTEIDYLPPPDTPVGKLGIGSIRFFNRAGYFQGLPPYGLKGSEHFSIMENFVHVNSHTILFSPTEVGRHEAVLESWWRDHKQPYLHPVEAEALPACPEPCDWPEITCSWDFQEIFVDPHWVRQFSFWTEPNDGYECIWLQNGSPLYNVGCEGTTMQISPFGMSIDLKVVAYDSEGRADLCEISEEIPPVLQDGG